MCAVSTWRAEAKLGGARGQDTTPEMRKTGPTTQTHPGGNPGANLKSISHKCHPIMVAFVWELTEETIDLPLGCLQGGCAMGSRCQGATLRAPTASQRPSVPMETTGPPRGGAGPGLWRGTGTWFRGPPICLHENESRLGGPTRRALYLGTGAFEPSWIENRWPGRKIFRLSSPACRDSQPRGASAIDRQR